MKEREFGTRLRELRKEAGFSLRQIADVVGVDFSYISKIEKGIMPPPSTKVIRRLAQILGANEEELVALAGKIPSDVSTILKKRGAINMLRLYNKVSEAPKMLSRPNFRRLYRVAAPIIMVIAVASSLWFASPIPVKAIDISVTNTSGSSTLPEGSPGATYQFKVTVEVSSVDRLPVYRVDIRIYNASDSSKKATLQSLPLDTVSKQSHALLEGSGSGSAEVAATASAYWGSGTSSDRGGYGFGYTSGSIDTINMSGTFGYGYGFHDYIGPAYITYTIYWTVPNASAWAGTYKIQPVVYGDDASLNKAFTVSSIPSFTISAPSEPEVPAVGGGAFVVTPGKVNVSDIVTLSGRFTDSVTVESADEKVQLNIPQNTVGKQKNGRPLHTISITPMTTPPAPPADANVIGLTYDFEPDGATYDPPISMTFTYDPTTVTDIDSLRVAMYDEASGTWITLEDFEVDPVTNTITARVSHFTPFSVLEITPVVEEEEEEAVEEEEEEVVEEEEEEVVEEEEEEVVEEEEEEVVEEEEEEVIEEEEEEVPTGGIAWWIWLIIGVAVVVVIGLLAWIVIRHRVA